MGEPGLHQTLDQLLHRRYGQSETPFTLQHAGSSGVVPCLQQAVETTQPILPVTGLRGLRLPKVRKTASRVPSLQRNYRQVVVGVRVVGAQIQDAAVQHLRSIQLPGLMMHPGQLHALLQRGLRQLLDARWRCWRSHFVSRPAEQARHMGLRLTPAFEHLRVSAFYMARETRLVHQWAGVHIGTQPCAQAGQVRQVTRQRNGKFHIGRLRLGHPFWPADAFQNRTAEPAHTGTTGQCHVGNAHVQHLEQCRARVVRKTIQANIQRPQHVPGRAVAADHQACRINSVGDELVLQRFLCGAALEVPAVDHQARVFHPSQYFGPHAYRTVVDAYRPG